MNLVEKSTWQMGAAVFVATVLVFAVNLRNGFIRFDDYDYIVLNEHIEPGLTPQTALWSFTAAGYASNWHPLAWMSHAADITMARLLRLDWRGEKNDVGIVTRTSGSFPALVHAENILWHAANAVLLWLLMMAFARSLGGTSNWMPLVAAGAALLWALHPLRVEVVAWAAERKELVSVFFMLLTLLTLQTSKSRCLSLVCFILALLAKPVAVSLPMVTFTLDLTFWRRGFRDSVRRVLPFVVSSTAVCCLTMVSQTQGLAGGRDWPWLTRIVCAVEAPAVYLRQTVWPTGLCIDYDLPGWSSWPYFVAGVLILITMATVCLCWMRWPNRWSALGVLAAVWCYVGLLPMIGLVKVGYEPHSDRYTYWIGCGAAFCLFLAVDWLAPKWACERVNLARFACAVLLVLGITSVCQSLCWKDTTTLFSRAVAITQSAFFAHGLADDLVASQREAGRNKAEKVLRTLVSRNPTGAAHAAFALHLAAYCNAANTFSIDGERLSPFAEARLSAEQALAAGESEDLAYAALGFADYREGRFVSAYENMKKAMDRGFKSPIIPVKLDEWKNKADAQASMEGRNVQR